MKRALLFLTSLCLFSLASVDCTLGCTEVGCGSSSRVILSKLAATHAADLPVSVRACVDSNGCARADVEAGKCTVTDGNADCSVDADGTVTLDLFGVQLQDNGVHTLSVTVEDGDGNTLSEKSAPLTIVESQPNGEGCEPTCYGTKAVTLDL